MLEIKTEIEQRIRNLFVECERELRIALDQKVEIDHFKERIKRKTN